MTKLSPVPPQFQPAIVIPQDRPVYRIGEGKFFGPDDHLYEENEIIAWDEEPNEEMFPLNQLAKDKMVDYLKKLDAAGQKVADKLGLGYVSRESAFENAQLLAKEDAKRVQVIGGKQDVTVMGAKKRGKSRVERIAGEPMVPMMQAKGKLSLGQSKE